MCIVSDTGIIEFTKILIVIYHGDNIPDKLGLNSAHEQRRILLRNGDDVNLAHLPEISNSVSK